MANLTTSQDCKQAVLQHAGELTGGTSAYNTRAMTYLNRMLLELCSGGDTFVPDMGEPWEWAKAQHPGTLVLQPAYNTGAVTLTAGSANGSFSVAPTTSMAGRMLKITGRQEFFRILTHTASATAFTIDVAYTDESGTFDFNAYKLDYDLTASTGILRLIEPMRAYRGQIFPEAYEAKIYSTSEQELSRQYPLHSLLSGVPTMFAVTYISGGTYSVRFNATPGSQTKVEFWYIPVPAAMTDSGSEIPIVPRADLPVLVFGATYFLMLDKNDSRADMFFRMTQSKLQSMVTSRRKQMYQSGKNFGRVKARQDDLTSNIVRTASGIWIAP